MSDNNPKRQAELWESGQDNGQNSHRKLGGQKRTQGDPQLKQFQKHKLNIKNCNLRLTRKEQAETCDQTWQPSLR